ncbi:hypothetical protein Barb4_05261 [Bacteroidales bacterium Barb4]|jgi:hypothetical protein|nr:hypothetical protein Barb4_05261 [Bacteroidales bacterium Barb4]
MAEMFIALSGWWKCRKIIAYLSREALDAPIQSREHYESTAGLTPQIMGV